MTKKILILVSGLLFSHLALAAEFQMSELMHLNGLQGVLQENNHSCSVQVRYDVDAEYNDLILLEEGYAVPSLEGKLVTDYKNENGVVTLKAFDKGPVQGVSDDDKKAYNVEHVLEAKEGVVSMKISYEENCVKLFGKWRCASSGSTTRTCLIQK